MVRRGVSLLLAVVLFQCCQLVLMNKHFDFCKKQTKVSDSDVHDFIETIEAAETNKKLMCFAACLLEVYEMVRKCKFDYVDAREYYKTIKDNEMVNAIDACSDSIQSTERCECGYQVYKCLANYNGTSTSS